MDFENQKMLESFFNKRQTYPLVKKELLSSEAVIKRIQASLLDEAFCLDLLIQMCLAKRSTVAALVGQMKHHFDGDHQATADGLYRACEADLLDWDPAKEQFILIFDLDRKTHDLIRQYQYLPPMVVPPMEVTQNRGSGYVTITTDSLILRDNHHEGELCLDSINRFNQIPLAINDRVVKGIRNEWKNLDKQKDDETFEEFKERRKAFEKYEKDSFFTIALMMEMGNEFRLTHKTDKRGRTYCQGYHITYQGNCWNKAVIEFARKEKVNGT